MTYLSSIKFVFIHVIAHNIMQMKTNLGNTMSNKVSWARKSVKETAFGLVFKNQKIGRSRPGPLAGPTGEFGRWYKF